MAHTDHSQEWLRLTRLYQELDDVDLLQLRDDFDSLTPMAQEILRPILQTRNLWRGREVAKSNNPYNPTSGLFISTDYSGCEGTRHRPGS
jgi:hypothetical protein